MKHIRHVPPKQACPECGRKGGMQPHRDPYNGRPALICRYCGEGHYLAALSRQAEKETA